MGQLRRFKESDIIPLLNFCNRNMAFDQFTEPLLREKILEDPDYSPENVLIYQEDDQILGFIDGVTREINNEKIGYVKLMVVEKKYRRQGIGTQLYQELENRFKKLGMQKVRVYDVPFNYFMPGIDPRYTPALAFFEVQGFKRFADTSNMVVDLTNQSFETKEQEKELLGQGITIKRADYQDRDELLSFIEEYFPLWRYEVMNAYNSIPIAIHIALVGDKIKAFSAHNGNNFGTGWFGPMGTHPDLRGKGIGSILLKRCLRDMQNWGLEKSIIPWVGPIRFYSYYVNAVVDRVFWRYEKKV
ncbi:MAG: GNAT family N-acetyltransferase [Caldisericaceae bacterium]|nr:GNAT family N-acetyltransferase [Caldisericaceae bacterium]